MRHVLRRNTVSVRMLFALLLIAPLNAAEAQSQREGRYYERGQEGWFWYAPEPAPPVEPEVTVEPEPEPITVPETPEVVDAPAEQPAEATSQPAPMSAAWFRAHLDDYRDRAIDAPSSENVEAYLYLQRIALERASNFAEATNSATVRDPWLDANSERPLATYAAQAVDAQAEAARNAVLSELAKEAGILFFYKGACPLCDSQAGVLKLANQAHGFEIIAVSLDGSPPAGGLISHRADEGQAKRLGVVSVPATFLVRPPDLIAPIAQAPLDLKTLGRRVIGLAHGAGLIPDETYLATRALKRPFNMPADFDDLTPEVMDDPAKLVAHIRQKLGIPDLGGP